MNIEGFSPPPQSPIRDRDVPLDGHHLAGKRVALLVTGGIAAIKAPLIARALRRRGANVVVFTSNEALRYTTREALEWSSNNPVITQLTANAEHLSDSDPFEAYLVAPATYNTINKIAHGISDSPVTTALAVAIGRMERSLSTLLIAPTMHGTLHNSLLTESLHKLVDMGVHIIPPRSGYGKHNIPSEEMLVSEVCRATSNSPLRNQATLVTGGPIPTPIDEVRQITNRFTGQLGNEIATELYLRGADVLLVHGSSTIQPPDWVPSLYAPSYSNYYTYVMNALKEKQYAAGVFSAAVTDFQINTPRRGKIPSNGPLSLELVPTAKIIDEVKSRFPHIYLVTFKYEQNRSHQQLMSIAQQRIKNGFPLVVANRGNETGPDGEQIAYLLTSSGPPQKATGKPAIARAITDQLELVLAPRSR